MTEKQLFGVVVRGLGVWFAASGVQELWNVIVLAFSKYANEPGEYPILYTATIALIWFAVCYVLLRNSDIIVDLAYGQQGGQQHSAN